MVIGLLALLSVAPEGRAVTGTLGRSGTVAVKLAPVIEYVAAANEDGQGSDDSAAADVGFDVTCTLALDKSPLNVLGSLRDVADDTTTAYAGTGAIPVPLLQHHRKTHSS